MGKPFFVHQQVSQLSNLEALRYWWVRSRKAPNPSWYIERVFWAVGSAVEHLVHIEGVTGSNPVPPTISIVIAKLVFRIFNLILLPWELWESENLCPESNESIEIFDDSDDFQVRTSH